jgi:hypothetical protein
VRVPRPRARPASGSARARLRKGARKCRRRPDRCAALRAPPETHRRRGRCCAAREHGRSADRVRPARARPRFAPPPARRCLCPAPSGSMPAARPHARRPAAARARASTRSPRRPDATERAAGGLVRCGRSFQLRIVDFGLRIGESVNRSRDSWFGEPCFAWSIRRVDVHLESEIRNAKSAMQLGLHFEIFMYARMSS